MSFFHDKAGDAVATQWQASLYYAYHVLLNESSTLGAGISGSYGGQDINYAELQWGNQYNGSTYDPSLPTGEPAFAFTPHHEFDLGAGLHYQYGKRERYLSANDQLRFQAGFSAAHLLRPEVSFYGSAEKLAIRYTGYANALFGLGNSNISLAPSILYNKQGKQSEWLAGAAFRYSLKEESKRTGFEHASAFWLGVHYRAKDAFVPSILFEKGNFAVGISYEINTSSLDAASNSNGGIEISLRFMSFADMTKTFKRNVRNL